MRFLYRIPSSAMEPSTAMASAVRVFSAIKQRVPEFHTKQMRNLFSQNVLKITWSNDNPIKRHVLDWTYKSLTGEYGNNVTILLTS